MFNEEFKDEYEAALVSYDRAMKILYDMLSEPSALDETKIRIIDDEEGKLYQQVKEARDKWVEAKEKYFNLT